MTLEVICKELKNWFTKDEDKNFDTFTISGGIISPSDFLLPNQYFRIVGSVFNDGVYQFKDANTAIEGLTDETITDGAVWTMSIPKSVIEGLTTLNQWIDANKETLDSPYTSESFGGYSYSKSTGGNNATESKGNVTLNQKINELFGRYRKAREL